MRDGEHAQIGPAQPNGMEVSIRELHFGGGEAEYKDLHGAKVAERIQGISKSIGLDLPSCGGARVVDVDLENG